MATDGDCAVAKRGKRARRRDVFFMIWELHKEVSD
jgi:hypothetical protein